MLREWENDLEKGEFINEFVVGAARSYSYRTNTGTYVIKQKGITMDAATSKLITFETMRDMELNKTILKSEDIYTFRWDAKSKYVVTKCLSRSVRSSFNTTRTIDGRGTYPFGYEQEESKQ